MNTVSGSKAWRWYGIRGTVFARDSRGAPAEILGTIRDITERRQADEQLQKQAALLEIARDAILILDLDLKIRYWNRGAEILTFARGVKGNVGSVQIGQVLEEVETMAKRTFDRSITVSRECDPELQGDRSREETGYTAAEVTRGNGELVLIAADETTIVDIVRETLTRRGDTRAPN